jgi:hypothetical protein
MSTWSQLFEWNLWFIMQTWEVWAVVFGRQFVLWFAVDFSWKTSIPAFIIVAVFAFPVIALTLGARVGP